MKLRKLLSGLLALCMVLTLLPSNVHATDTRAALAFKDAKVPASNEQKVSMQATLDGAKLYAVGDQYHQETEPNDSLADANEIYHDYTVEGSISGDNVDCYVFEVDSLSEVTVASACTTDGLVYGIYDPVTDQYLAECEYLGYDEEYQLHSDGLYCELSAGTYYLVFIDFYENYLEYIFYLEIPQFYLALIYLV